VDFSYRCVQAVISLHRNWHPCELNEISSAQGYILLTETDSKVNTEFINIFKPNTLLPCTSMSRMSKYTGQGNTNVLETYGPLINYGRLQGDMEQVPH